MLIITKPHNLMEKGASMIEEKDGKMVRYIVFFVVDNYEGFNVEKIDVFHISVIIAYFLLIINLIYRYSK